MIYYLENLNSEVLKNYYFVNDFLIPNNFGYKVLIFSLILFILLFLNFEKKILSKFLYIFGFITYFGTFILTQKLTDESFINFEMAYNFYHFGMFSFSPFEKVSGSTDLLFNLFMSFFAQTRESLVLSYHVINFFLGLFTILFIYKIINPKFFILKITTIIFICFYAPLVEIYSNFFPNTIIGFLFVLMVYSLTNQNKNSVFFYTSTILFRVEGIIIATMGFFVDFFINKKKNYLFLFLIPFFYFIYFNLHKYFFGFYFPTPLKFKSFGFDQVSMLLSEDYLSMVLDFFNFFHLISVILLIFLAFVIYKKSNFSELMSKMITKKFLILSVLFIFSLSVFLILEPTIFGVNFDNRYFVFMEIMLVTYPMYILNEVYEKLYFNNKLILPLNSIIFFILFFTILTPSNSNKQNIFSNGTKYSYNVYSKYEQRGATSINTSKARGASGHILDKIIPREWKIGIHELNAFGFYNDRHLHHLWGYTNPAIANSNIVASYSRQRNNPEYFWEQELDLIWTFAYNLNFWDDKINQINTVGDLKPYKGSNLTKNHNLVGDINKFFKNYDTIILRVDNYLIYLHTLKNKTNIFIDILKEQNFAMKFKKPINKEIIFKNNKKDISKFYIF